MIKVTFNQLGICTSCQATFIVDDESDSEFDRKCDDCRDGTVLSLVELCDIANDYKELQTAYNELKDVLF